MSERHRPEPPRPIPPDDPRRELVVVSPDDEGLSSLALVGDTYTTLVGGAQTAGAYCLIDMRVPPGGGPGPHRHDFEEMFTVLEGSLEFTFRGEVHTASAGQTLNIPANAPHFFHNTSNSPAHVLCLCTPAGQEEFFAAVGDPLAGPHSPAPELQGEELQRKLDRMAELAPRFRTELLAP